MQLLTVWVYRGHRRSLLIRRELSTSLFDPPLFPLLLTVLLIAGHSSFGGAILQQGLVPFMVLVTILLFCAIYPDPILRWNNVLIQTGYSSDRNEIKTGIATENEAGILPVFLAEKKVVRRFLQHLVFIIELQVR